MMHNVATKSSSFAVYNNSDTFGHTTLNGHYFFEATGPLWWSLAWLPLYKELVTTGVLTRPLACPPISVGLVHTQLIIRNGRPQSYSCLRLTINTAGWTKEEHDIGMQL